MIGVKGPQRSNPKPNALHYNYYKSWQRGTYSTQSKRPVCEHSLKTFPNPPTTTNPYQRTHRQNFKPKQDGRRENWVIRHFIVVCGGSNTDYKSSEPSKTLVMLRLGRPSLNMEAAVTRLK